MLSLTSDRLLGLVVKASASRAEDPGFESRLRLLSMVGAGKADVVVCLLVGCLTSQRHASVSQGRICTDNFTCCHTEIEVADRTFHLNQSEYTDTGPTSPSTHPVTPGAQCQILGHECDSTPEKSRRKSGFEPGIFRSRGGRLNH